MVTWNVWPTPKYGLSADELAAVTTGTTDRLRDMVGRLSRDDWASGEQWYFIAHGVALGLAAMYSAPVSATAGVIAALSPRIRWETNLEDAWEVMHLGDEGSTTALMANFWKAVNIRGGYDPDLILGGRKVRSFYRNILDPHGSLDVTLDGWMVTALELPSHRYLERRGVYDAISDGFREVAAEHGLLPHQLQAAVWVHTRGRA